MPPPLILLSDGRSEDQRVLAATVTEIAAREIGSTNQDRSLWNPLARDFGAAYFAMPEEGVSAAATLIDLNVVHQELGYHLACADLAAHHLAVWLLARAETSHVDGATLTDLSLGMTRAALHLPTPHSLGDVHIDQKGDGPTVTGTIKTFVSAPDADLLVVRAFGSEGRSSWYLIRGDDAALHPLTAMDLTRRAAGVEFDKSPATEIGPVDESTLAQLRHLLAYLQACEAVGGTRRCLELAVDYARTREQFGRVIGSFQAVKHLLARGLVRLERARAALAGATRDGLDAPLVLAATQRVSAQAYVECAQDLVQVLGGLGFTWEHEAHLHLRRATSARSLGPPVAFPEAKPELEAPPSEFVRRVRRWCHEHGVTAESRPARERRMDDARIAAARKFRASLADAGLGGLTWPTEVGGQGLSPSVAHEFAEASRGFDTYADVATISLGIVAPLLINLGSTGQKSRYLPPLMRLDHLWCQLYSEPGCGSDLAAVATRATKVDGDYVLRGQKVWTTNAHAAEFGLLLARTDPSALKHRGLTMFIVDMSSRGLQVRRIREITGEEEFCEVFLDDVEISQDCIVGEVNDGWRVALATLAYERLALGSGTYGDLAVGRYEGLNRLANETGALGDPLIRRELDDLRLDEVALTEYMTRMAQLVSQGQDPGPAASVCKLMTAELVKRAAELGVRVAGVDAVVWDPNLLDADDVAYQYLYAPSTSIAGGTDHIQRNIIAEQLLGLPREPRVTLTGVDR